MTDIEWTDVTWNPVRGCSLVSAGCTNCYAMKQAHRFSGEGQPYEGLTELSKHGPRWKGEARFIPEMLDKPLKWKKPRRIFVNSMSDLFHDDIADEKIAAVFGVMAACPQHTFQILTKRPERMVAWFKWMWRFADQHRAIAVAPSEHLTGLACAYATLGESAPMLDAAYAAAQGDDGRGAWPLPNVWLGVSVEDQQRADERIPLLVQAPAAVRFLSCEPLLGPLDIAKQLEQVDHTGDYVPDRIHWVIVGGESGPGARSCNEEHVRSVVQQCRRASVPVFVKQLGSKPYVVAHGDPRAHGSATRMIPLRQRDRKGGDMSEWSGDLRVRESPR